MIDADTQSSLEPLEFRQPPGYVNPLRNETPAYLLWVVILSFLMIFPLSCVVKSCATHHPPINDAD